MTGFHFSYLFNWDLVVQSFPFVIQGAKYTILIAIASIIIGLIAGFFIALGRMSKLWILRLPSKAYISFMRGTPLLVILFILYYGLPMVNIELSSVTAAVLGMSLNSAAYDAEAIRSAISSVPRGQWEAAATLRMSGMQTLRRIVIPQAARIALPPLTNIFLDVVKGTSLAAVITVPELLYNAKVVAGETYESLTMYILIALIYWAICSIVSFGQNQLEKRYSRHVKS